MLRVLYYYYYLFYTKVLVQPEPHFVTVLALSASEGFLINYSIDFLSAHLLCKVFHEMWYKLLMVVILLMINFWYYSKQGIDKKIVKERPKILGSHALSITVTLTFFLVTTSFLFWMADYLKVVIQNCQ